MTASRDAAQMHSGGASLAQLVARILADLPGLISDRVNLLALELQSAGVAIAWLIAVAVAGGVLLSTAWLALWAGIAMLMRQNAVAWPWIALLVIAVNLAAAIIMLQLGRVFLRRVTLPATVRQLTSAASATADPPAAPQPAP